MAYVSISRDLLRDVNFNIERMRDAEFNSLPAPVDAAKDLPHDIEFVEGIYTKLLDRVADLADRLRPYDNKYEWRLEMKFPYDPEVLTMDILTARVSLPSMATPVLQRPQGYYATHIDIAVAPQIHPALMEVATRARVQHECHKRWLAVQKQIKEFLGKCKSLNEAMKLWPDVVRYIPPSYVNRVNEKRSATKSVGQAEEALKALDVDMIQSSTVLARMAGASA